MSIYSRSNNYINLLSDFWISFFSDAQLLDKAMTGVAEVLKSLYFRFLQMQVPLPIADTPVFQEQFWNLIELQADEAQLVYYRGAQYFKYPLDEAYAHIPFLYNVLFGPTLALQEYVDYLIVRESTTDVTIGLDNTRNIDSFILFKVKEPVGSNPYNGDPFSNNEIPKRIVEAKTIIALWAPKTFVDSEDLYKQFGVLFSTWQFSSEAYKLFLEGLLRLYTQGPSIAAMNAGLNLAAGYPVSRQTETIIEVEIYVDETRGVNQFRLKSDQGNEYEIARTLISIFDESVTPPSINTYVSPRLLLSGVNGNPDFSSVSIGEGVYPVSWDVDRLGSFLSDIRVVDSYNEPRWWRKQLGRLSSRLVPNLSVTERQDPEIQEYLFENYLRYNTFGIFLDYRVIRDELKVINNYLDIMGQIKPKHKAFIVYEEDLRVITVMGAGDTLSSTDDEGDVDYSAGVTLLHKFFAETRHSTPFVVGMYLPLQKPAPVIETEDFSEVLFAPVTNGPPDFDGTAFEILSAGLVLNNGGTDPVVQTGDLLLLTDDSAGSGTCFGLFPPQLVNISNGFILEFSYNLSAEDLSFTAPGFSVVLRDSTLDLTDFSSYEGVASNNPGYDEAVDQFVIEFDAHISDDVNDPSNQHIAFMGSLTGAVGPDHDEFEIKHVEASVTGSHIVRIVYTGSTLAVYMDNMFMPILMDELDLSDYVDLTDGACLIGLVGASMNNSSNRSNLTLKSLSLDAPYTDYPLYLKGPVPVGASMPMGSSYDYVKFKYHWGSSLEEGKGVQTFHDLGSHFGPLVVGGGSVVGGLSSGMLQEYIRIVRTQQPINVSAEFELSPVLGYRFNWDAVEGADHYMLTRDDKPVALTNTNTLLEIPLSFDTDHVYKVYASYRGLLSKGSDDVINPSDPYVLVYDFHEGSGTILNDVSIIPENPGTIEQGTGDGNIVALFSFSEGSGSVLSDSGVYGNNASIVVDAEPPSPYVAVFSFSEGSGSVLSDSGVYGNNASIEHETPATPTLLAGGFTNSTHDVYWSAVPGAVSYEVDIASDSGFSTIITLSASVDDPFYTIETMTPSVPAFIRVRSVSADALTSGNSSTLEVVVTDRLILSIQGFLYSSLTDMTELQPLRVKEGPAYTSNVAGVDPFYDAVNDLIFFSSVPAYLLADPLLSADTYQIFSIKPDGSELTQITSGGLTAYRPRVSPSGLKLAYASSTEGIRVADVDGLNDVLLGGTSATEDYPCFSADSLTLVHGSNNDPSYRITTSTLAGDSRSNISTTSYAEQPTTLGNTVLYAAFSGGATHIASNVVSGGSETTVTTSFFSKRNPAWLNSNEFFFIRQSNSTLYHHNISTTDEVQVSSAYEIQSLTVYKV